MKKKYSYHYTSKDNWETIKKEGLLPYRIDKPEFAEAGISPVEGIWAWKKNPKGVSENGTVIFQIQKGCGQIVKLKLDTTGKRTLYKGEQGITLHHYGVIGNFRYHNGDAAEIITEKIEPDRIELMREFDIEKFDL